MPARLTSARLLLSLTSCVALLQGCAASAKPAVVAAEPQRDSAPVAQRPIQPFRSSAPEEFVSEGVKAERTLVVGDMIRTGLITTVEQGRPGILRTGVGAKFHSHETRNYHFAQLAAAYFTWTVENQPLIIELWEGGKKIGEYVNETFRFGPRHTKPLDCPENATTGLCGGELVAAPGQQAIPEGTPAAEAARSEPDAYARQRSGFHFGLGLGGGAADLTCKGCDFPSESGVSGFLSVDRSLGPKTLLGVEGTGWTRNESDTKARVYSLMAQVTRYLSTTSGLFLRAGVGLVGYHEETGNGNLTAKAPGFSGRVGYEFGEGDVVFVPYVALARTFGGVDEQRDGRYAGRNVAIFHVQLGLSLAAY